MAFLHHINLPVSDLGAAADFYSRCIGMARIERPAFPNPGVWLRMGSLEVHLIQRPSGMERRQGGVTHMDVHFAIRFPDIEEVIDRLHRNGFRADLSRDDPNCIVLDPHSKAGYPQAFICDPDGYVIELNAERL